MDPSEPASNERQGRGSSGAGTVGRLIVVTDRRLAGEAGYDLVDVVAAAVEAGARTVLLREKDLPRDERAVLARAIAELLDPEGGVLLVASDAGLGREVGAAGVHLAAADPAERTFFEPKRLPSNHAGSKNVHPEGGRRLLVGRSCHSVAELRAAQEEGVDYATLSPIWATPSKPGYGPPLGPEGLARAVAAVPDLPVYALSGVGPRRIAACLAAGARGVAVMGEVMRAPDPGSTVEALLTQLRPSEAAGTRGS
jgi:thiamine-phosphate pyrophosphorylase